MKGKVDDEIRDCERVGWVMDFVSLFAMCTHTARRVLFLQRFDYGSLIRFLVLVLLLSLMVGCICTRPFFFLRVIRSPQRHSSSSSSRSITKYIRAVDAFARSNYTRFDQTNNQRTLQCNRRKGKCNKTFHGWLIHNIYSCI